MPEPQASRAVFRRRHRLGHARAFDAVYAARLRKARGPLTVLVRARPAGEGPPNPRLGLSVGRRVGNAATRNRVKRVLRESFRLRMGDLPEPPGGGAYDLVVQVRRHEPQRLFAYADLLIELVRACHDEAQKRADRRTEARAHRQAGSETSGA